MLITGGYNCCALDGTVLWVTVQWRWRVLSCPIPSQLMSQVPAAFFEHQLSVIVIVICIVVIITVIMVIIIIGGETGCGSGEGD